MKLRTILVSSLLVTTFSANAFDFLDSIKEAFGFGDKPATEQVQKAAEENAAVESVKEIAAQAPTDIVGYASEQLGLSPEMTSGALGALFKVAKDNLGDNFSSITEAIPGVESYIQGAPAEAAKSSLGGLASSLGGDELGELGQAAASLGYLNSAFEQLGIPKETILPVVNTVTSYLEANDYGTAAAMLNKGVNFL
jgi:hypothetical protein